jgi:hypothetical protein
MSATAQPSPPRRSWAYRALKWFTVLYALLIVLELSLRFVFGLGIPVLYQYDAACGYLPVPNQQVRRFFSENDINSFGMRSPEIPAHKSPGTLRILFLGDSVTYGTTYVDQSQIFTSLLARDLPRQLHRQVEVLNASAGAWAPANEAGYLESRGTFDAELVVFVLNTGDLVQPMNRQPLLLANGYPEHRPPFALYELWVRYVRPRILRSGSAVDAGSQAATVDIAHQTPPVLEVLDEARRFAREHRAELRIVYTPAHGGEWESLQYARGFEMLRSWASRNQVPLLDLSSDLASRPMSEIYQDSIHLKPAGNQIVADSVEHKWTWPDSKD